MHARSSIEIFESEESAARNILRFGHAMEIQGFSFGNEHWDLKSERHPSAN